MDVNPTAVVFLQSLIFLLQPPKQRRRDRLLPPPVAGCASEQASRPHHILASLACLSLYSPTPPVIFRRRQPNQSTLVLSTAWAATAVSSPAPCRSLRRPRRRPPPWCSRRGVVNDDHPTAVVLLQPLVFLPQPPKAAPVVPHAPASRGRLCCRGGLTAPILLPPLARPSLHSPTPPVIPW